MEKKTPDLIFENEKRKKDIKKLESDIKRLEDEINAAYGRLGKSIYALSEREIKGINEKTDIIVEMKQKLRKLRKQHMPDRE